MLVAASDRIRSELGWEPRKPALEEMVADAWAFAQAHPDGYSSSRNDPQSSRRAQRAGTTSSAGRVASIIRIRSGSSAASSR